MPRATTTGRSANACDSCRRRKVKCSGNQPCETCVRHGLRCQMGPAERNGYSESYVQKLLYKIKRQERQLQQRRQSLGAPSPPGTSHSNDTNRSFDDFTIAGDGEGECMDMTIGHDEILTPTTDLASGPAFESTVNCIVRDHAANHASKRTSIDASAVESDGETTSPDQWHSSADLVNQLPRPRALSKDDSYRLFDTFISLMGINQHFLDPRMFTDSMDLLYKNDSARASQEQTIWFTQYLLVMAMGMLIGSPSEESENLPGNAHFAEAMGRLPPMHKLGSYGVISVEILCLAGLYLQWCDRKHDAYLYIGAAVRLAMALGCALPHEEQQGVSSEISHRTRVWWTAYMLDRRLSAGLGLPAGADERQIRADLPRSSAGFQPPIPMIINIQIARATGEIMHSLYGHNQITQRDLVKKIQDMLNNLYETGRSIPKSLAIDFDSPHLSVTRTSASLFLMLFQAIILCLRPVILQCVKEKVQSSGRQRTPVTESSAIDRLCNSCREAASKTIRIVSTLKRDESIALFGYFDLDATFSAAFILVMMGFVEGNDAGGPPEGLSQAAEVLQYLSNAGNKAAERRLNELRQFCSRVWALNPTSSNWCWLGFDNPGVPGVPGSSPPSFDANLEDQENDAIPPTRQEPEMFGSDVWHEDAASSFFHFDSLGDLPMEPTSDMVDIYSSYNDPNLPLTGVDELDWAEVGKMFQLREVP